MGPRPPRHGSTTEMRGHPHVHPLAALACHGAGHGHDVRRTCMSDCPAAAAGSCDTALRRARRRPRRGRDPTPRDLRRGDVPRSHRDPPRPPRVGLPAPRGRGHLGRDLPPGPQGSRTTWCSARSCSPAARPPQIDAAARHPGRLRGARGASPRATPAASSRPVPAARTSARSRPAGRRPCAPDRVHVLVVPSHADPRGRALVAPSVDLVGFDASRLPLPDVRISGHVRRSLDLARDGAAPGRRRAAARAGRAVAQGARRGRVRRARRHRGPAACTRATAEPGSTTSCRSRPTRWRTSWSR